MPGMEELLTRPHFLARWYEPLIMAPFVLMVLISLKFSPHREHPALDLTLISLWSVWLIGVFGYVRSAFSGSWLFRRESPGMELESDVVPAEDPEKRQRSNLPCLIKR